MQYPPLRIATAVNRITLVLLVSQLAACFLDLPGSADAAEYPQFLAVDAGCDTEDWWSLTASVRQDEGESLVTAVWVEVQLLLYDDLGQLFFDDYLGSIALDPLGGDDWGIQLHPEDTFLDCDAPGDYLFHFYAEDSEGDLAGADLLN